MGGEVIRAAIYGALSATVAIGLWWFGGFPTLAVVLAVLAVLWLVLAALWLWRGPGPGR